MTMKEYAPAKINLFLDVIRKREDGYHDLGTVFQTVDAGDTVEATLREDDEIRLTYNEPQNYPLESDLVASRLQIWYRLCRRAMTMA